MNRIQAIWLHPEYQAAYFQIQQLEQDRPYCRHTMAHFLDVARLMYIEVIEQQLPIPREVIYAAALLHDIGRGQQYTQGTPHHIASVAMAKRILPDCGFASEETERICAAIADHRMVPETERTLSALLYRWDKASRTCFCCPASDSCNWSEEKKNQQIYL